MARTRCRVLTKRTPQHTGIKKTYPRQGARPESWESSSQEGMWDCASVWEGLEIKARDFRNRGWSAVASFSKLHAFFLPSFAILPSSTRKPAHLVSRACHQAFRLEEQAFPCRMSAAHVSGRLKGRWYCLINHLNMPGVINACCILHNIWDSTGETLGVGKEQKVNIFWTLWIDKDRDGVTIWSKKQPEMPSPPPLRGKATTGAWMHSNQRVFILFGFVRIWQCWG